MNEDLNEKQATAIRFISHDFKNDLKQLFLNYLFNGWQALTFPASSDISRLSVAPLNLKSKISPKNFPNLLELVSVLQTHTLKCQGCSRGVIRHNIAMHPKIFGLQRYAIC